MWIFDSYCNGCVELWGNKSGLPKVSAAYLKPCKPRGLFAQKKTIRHPF
jgi:hypothetical protein